MHVSAERSPVETIYCSGGLGVEKWIKFHMGSNARCGPVSLVLRGCMIGGVSPGLMAEGQRRRAG